MRIIVYDIEIATNVEDTPGGWGAARNGACGISCVCLYDSLSGRFHVYDIHRLAEAMEHLNSADLLVGYNCNNFDKPCLEGVSGMALFPEHYDILAEIWKAAGKKIKGYKLGEVVPRTLGLEKQDTGEHAPTLFQQGRMGELIDYCINDVHITKELFKYVCVFGAVVSPDDEDFTVRKPPVDEDDIMAL